MDPFNLDKKNDFDFEDNFTIEIWVERRGRKKNTYLSGWDLEKSELKNHLKTLKKSLGCNGCIKNITTDKEDIKVLHLQGDRVNDLNTYLLKNSVTEESITIRG
jgi:translation initiation factor 1 (eIF-1/SUI1)